MIRQVVFVVLIAGCAFAQKTQSPAPRGSDSTQLVALERMWNQAQVTRDATAISALIGDRFVNTEYDGEVSDRQKFLADFADPEFKPSMMNIDSVEVELYATTAVVTGNYHTKGIYAGRAYEHFGRFTDTWVLLGNRWLCVASHTSLVKK